MIVESVLDQEVLAEVTREPMFLKLLHANLSEDYQDEYPPELYNAIGRSLQRLKRAGLIELCGRPRRWVRTNGVACIEEASDG
jgi:hypothetical protein